VLITNFARMCLCVDPTAHDNYAIRLASREGHTEVVKSLLTFPGVDPTAPDNFRF